jgi:hypothetical protein
VLLLPLPIAVVRAGHHEVLAQVALAIEAAVVSTDDGSERAQAVLRRDGSEVEQQVLRSALLLCRRREDDVTRISVTRPGDPYLLEEGFDLGPGVIVLSVPLAVDD